MANVKPLRISGGQVEQFQSGDTVDPAVGGTGLASYAVGDLLYASGSAALSRLADVAVGSVLVSGGVTTAPAWSTTPQVSRIGIGTAADATIPLTVSAAPTTGAGAAMPTTNAVINLVGSGDNIVLTNGDAASRTSSIQFRGSTSADNHYFSSGRILSGFAGTGYADSYIKIGSASGNNTFNDEVTVKNGNVGIGQTSPAFQLDMSLTSTATSGSVNQINTLFDANPASANTGTFRNFFVVQSDSGCAQNINAIHGLDTRPSHHGSGTLSAIRGVFARAESDGSGGITSAYGMEARVATLTGSTATIGSAYGYSVFISTVSGSTITTAYGLYVEVMTRGGTISNAFGIYVADTTAVNYLGGRLAVGSGIPLLPNPNAPLIVAEALGAGIPTVGTLWNSTAVAADQGGRLLFAGGTAGNGLATINAAFKTSATTGGGYLYFATRAPTSGTLTEAMRIDENQRVGIGTTPVCAFDLQSDDVTTGIIKVNLHNGALGTKPRYAMCQTRITTTNATETFPDFQFQTINSSATLVRAHIVGRRTGGSSGSTDDSAAYIVVAVFKTNSSGTVFLITSTTTTVGESQAGWDARLAAGSGLNLIAAGVTGAANNNVSWHLTAEFWDVTT